jgi:hypothetical protein
MFTDFDEFSVPTYTLTEEFGGVTKCVEFKESNMEITFYHFMEFMEYVGFGKESLKELFEEYFRDMNPKEDE